MAFTDPINRRRKQPASTRTTQFHDRLRDDASPDEVEHILI